MDTLTTEISTSIGQYADVNVRRQIFLMIMYCSGGLLLLITAYVLYIKRFKRAKLEAINNISLQTSRNDVFNQITEFLIISPIIEFVTLKLLNEKEEEIEVLFEGEINAIDQKVTFKPKSYEPGIYYLSLRSKSANILRKIRVVSEA